MSRACLTVTECVLTGPTPASSAPGTGSLPGMYHVKRLPRQRRPFRRRPRLRFHQPQPPQRRLQTAHCAYNIYRYSIKWSSYPRWSTASEIDNAGFNIYRAESENGEILKINRALIPAKGSSTQGAAYEFVDSDVKNRKTYYYKLEDIDLNGVSTFHGPVAETPRLIFGFGIRCS